MTSTVSAPVGSAAAPARRARLRRSASFELSQRRSLLVGAIIVVVVVIFGALLHAAVGWVAILAAVFAPYAVGRSTRPGSDLVRARLAISRGDGVRGRVALIALAQLAFAAIALVVSHAGPIAGGTEGSSVEMRVLAHLVDASSWAPGIVWAWVVVGRDCLRRPWSPVAGTAFLVWFSCWFALRTWFGVEGLAPFSGGTVSWPSTGQILGQLAIGGSVLAVGLAVLAWRIRRWIAIA